jgi:hypothetical protein
LPRPLYKCKSGAKKAGSVQRSKHSFGVVLRLENDLQHAGIPRTFGLRGAHVCDRSGHVVATNLCGF